MLPINCDVVGILIKRHASPFVNDTSNYQKKNRYVLFHGSFNVFFTNQ